MNRASHLASLKLLGRASALSPPGYPPLLHNLALHIIPEFDFIIFKHANFVDIIHCFESCFLHLFLEERKMISRDK